MSCKKPIRCDADLHTAFKQLESVFRPLPELSKLMSVTCW